MSTSTVRRLCPEPTELPREALRALEERYERGQYVTALNEALAHGPLHTWQGLHSRVLAGRLATQLGAPRLSRLLAVRAYRQAPSEPVTTIYWSLHLLRTRGPLSALRVLHQADGQKPGEPALEAQLYLARSACLESLRDFSQAEEWPGAHGEVGKPGAHSAHGHKRAGQPRAENDGDHGSVRRNAQAAGFRVPKY